MTTRIRTALNDKGAAGVEYGILVAAIAAVIIAVVAAMGLHVFGAFDNFNKLPWA